MPDHSNIIHCAGAPRINIGHKFTSKARKVKKIAKISDHNKIEIIR